MVLLRTTLPVPYKPSAFRLYTLFVPACSPASSAATHLGFLPHPWQFWNYGRGRQRCRQARLDRASKYNGRDDRAVQRAGWRSHPSPFAKYKRSDDGPTCARRRESNRQPLSQVRDELDRESLRDHRYTTLAMMAALTQVINTAIVVWVQHPIS